MNYECFDRKGGEFDSGRLAFSHRNLCTSNSLTEENWNLLTTLKVNLFDKGRLENFDNGRLEYFDKGS